jgi:hypothetical protein
MNPLAYGERFIRLLKRNLIQIFEDDIVPGVKKEIMDNYDNLLMNKVPEGSLGRPEDFRELFAERLDEYPFIKTDGLLVKLSIPSNDTFDFGEGLSFLKHVLEGMAGFYYLIPIDTYRLLGYTPPSLRETLYLVREDDPLMDDVRKILGDTFLTPYVFSNSPPMDIFEDVQKHTSQNVAEAVKKAVAQAKNDFRRIY